MESKYRSYQRIAELHQRYVPDWRIGQLLSNVFSSSQTDCFYLNDDEIIAVVENYLKKVTERLGKDSSN